MNIIVLGPQGSGKGTQAEFLATRFLLEHIDIGGTLRQISKTETSLGCQIYEIQNISKGLVPNEILKKILQFKLQSLPREQGVVFDGIPRTLEQAVFLEEVMRRCGRLVDLAVYIPISTKESLRRIARRWSCRQCRRILIMDQDLKSSDDKCPHCGGKVYQREDDTPEGVKQRLRIFKQETLPVVEYYRKQGNLVIVNGEQAKEKVLAEILKKIAEIAE